MSSYKPIDSAGEVSRLYTLEEENRDSNSLWDQYLHIQIEALQTHTQTVGGKNETLDYSSFGANHSDKHMWRH
jgi:hypothetical protein